MEFLVEEYSFCTWFIDHCKKVGESIPLIACRILREYSGYFRSRSWDNRNLSTVVDALLFAANTSRWLHSVIYGSNIKMLWSDCMDHNIEYLFDDQSPEVDYKLQAEFFFSFQRWWRRRFGTVECRTMLALAMLRSRLDWCQSVSKMEGSASTPSSMSLKLTFLSTYCLFDGRK